MNDWLFEFVEESHKRLYSEKTPPVHQEAPRPAHAASREEAFEIAAQAAIARALTLVRVHENLVPEPFTRASRQTDSELLSELLDHKEVDAELFWLDVLRKAGTADPAATLARGILGYDKKSDKLVPISSMRKETKRIQRVLGADHPSSPLFLFFEDVILELKGVLDNRGALSDSREKRFVAAVGPIDDYGLRLWEKKLLGGPVLHLEAAADRMLDFLLSQARKQGKFFGWSRDSEGRAITAHETAKALSAIAPHGRNDKEFAIIKKAANSLKRMRDERTKTWNHGLHGPTGVTSYLSTAFCCRALFRVFGHDDPEAKESAERIQTYLATKQARRDGGLADGRSGFHSFLTYCHMLRAILTPRILIAPKTLRFARKAINPLQDLALYDSLRDDPHRYALALATGLLAIHELSTHDPKAVDTERRYEITKALTATANRKHRIKPFIIERLVGPDGQTTEFSHATTPWIISALATVPESNKAHLIASSLAMTRHMTDNGGVDFRPGHDGTTWGTAYAFGAIRRSVEIMKECHDRSAFDERKPRNENPLD